MNRAHTVFAIVLLLFVAGCGGGGGGGAGTVLNGFALKGPISGGTVTVTDGNGKVVLTATTNTTGKWGPMFLPSGTPVPVTITITGGTDTSTGAANETPLTRMVDQPSLLIGSFNADVNLFTTVATQIAQTRIASGEKLTTALTNAQNDVQTKLNFGAPASCSVFDSISPLLFGGVADANCAAAVIKANEQLASTIQNAAVLIAQAQNPPVVADVNFLGLAVGAASNSLFKPTTQCPPACNFLPISYPQCQDTKNAWPTKENLLGVVQAVCRICNSNCSTPSIQNNYSDTFNIAAAQTVTNVANNTFTVMPSVSTPNITINPLLALDTAFSSIVKTSSITVNADKLLSFSPSLQKPSPTTLQTQFNNMVLKTPAISSAVQSAIELAVTNNTTVAPNVVTQLQTQQQTNSQTLATAILTQNQNLVISNLRVGSKAAVPGLTPVTLDQNGSALNNAAVGVSDIYVTFNVQDLGYGTVLPGTLVQRVVSNDAHVIVKRQGAAVASFDWWIRPLEVFVDGLGGVVAIRIPAGAKIQGSVVTPAGTTLSFTGTNAALNIVATSVNGGMTIDLGALLVTAQNWLTANNPTPMTINPFTGNVPGSIYQASIEFAPNAVTPSYVLKPGTLNAANTFQPYINAASGSGFLNLTVIPQ